MKQSAAKTLGAAALGAAFAAVGAGAAHAAPALPDATTTLGGAARTVPVGDVTHEIPAARSAAASGNALGNGVADAARPTAAKVLSADPTKDDAAVRGLLGGLPAHGVTTQGMTANGVPLG